MTIFDDGGARGVRLERAARFGVLGSIGFLVIWPGMDTMIREVRAGVSGGTLEGDVTVLMVLIGGTTVGLMFPFTLIGEYVDRELVAQGLVNTEE